MEGGNEQRETILNLRAFLSPDAIARALHLDVAHVERVLGASGVGSQENAASSQAANEEAAVKRLMKDPEELCCPLSYELMEDPVVAADGFTYERAWVEEQFRRVPGKSPMTGVPISTTVLNPIQEKKSQILSFKKETVEEILTVVPRLAQQQALKLLERGEGFARSLLPDSSAKRKLSGLLLLRLKLPGADCGEVATEAVALLLELRDHEQLRQALVDMEEPTLVALLPSIGEDIISELHHAMHSCHAPCKRLVDKELAQRLASRLSEERLKTLWMLIQGNLDGDRPSWLPAAACVLSAQMHRLAVHVAGLDVDLLREADKFLDNQDGAIAFAQDFFKYDLGISTAEQWPLQSTAAIVQELAHRVGSASPEEKVRLLMKSHSIDFSHTEIREALSRELHRCILSQEARGGSEMEGCFLKLALAEGQELPVDVLPKLTLEDRHLSQASPSQLMLLAEQLGKHDRNPDGCRVAVFAAEAFKSLDQERQSEEAFLKAFNLDHLNGEAAQGVAEAVSSAHNRCNELEERCKELEVRSSLLSVVWDLSGYDFTGFVKGQEQLSDKFQLPGGIKAWLSLYPKGRSDSSEGKAALFLHVDKPAVVKWTWQSGDFGAWTSERDFSEDLTADGTPKGWGKANFMPISEANGRITLCILSVQLQGSTLSFS